MHKFMPSEILLDRGMRKGLHSELHIVFCFPDWKQTSNSNLEE